jgi:hypothetical protein
MACQDTVRPGEGLRNRRDVIHKATVLGSEEQLVGGFKSVRTARPYQSGRLNRTRERMSRLAS